MWYAEILTKRYKNSLYVMLHPREALEDLHSCMMAIAWKPQIITQQKPFSVVIS